MTSALRRAALLSLASLVVLLSIVGWLLAKDAVVCGRTLHAASAPADWRSWSLLGAEAEYRDDARGPGASYAPLQVGPSMCPFDGTSIPLPASLGATQNAEIDFPHRPVDWRLRADAARTRFVLTTSVDGPERLAGAYDVITEPRLALRSPNALRDLTVASLAALLAFVATAGAGRRARRAAILANEQIYIDGTSDGSGAVEAPSLDVPLAAPARKVAGKAGPVLLRVAIDRAAAYRTAPSAAILEMVRGERSALVARFHRQAMMRLRVPPIALLVVLLVIPPWTAIAHAAT